MEPKRSAAIVVHQGQKKVGWVGGCVWMCVARSAHGDWDGRQRVVDMVVAVVAVR